MIQKQEAADKGAENYELAVDMREMNFNLHKHRDNT